MSESTSAHPELSISFLADTLYERLVEHHVTVSAATRHIVETGVVPIEKSSR